MISAIGIVDNAIWDLRVRITGQRVQKPLGCSQDQVNSDASGTHLHLDDDTLVAQMLGFMDAGLSLDTNNPGTLSSAIDSARRFESFHIYGVEGPILADEIDSLAQLARSTCIPIAAGENHYGQWAFKELIEKRTVAIVLADVVKCGGVTEFLKIAAMADAHGLPVCPHFSNFVDVAYASALPNGLFHEFARDFFEPASQLMVHFVTPSDGRVAPLDKPGFGLGLGSDAKDLQDTPPPDARRGTAPDH